ncbi:MAG: hypothetical protein EOM20_03260 [Spartobacteria bacterium]|nr:hypothetical protein [Spartobacteria bacterium]
MTSNDDLMDIAAEAGVDVAPKDDKKASKTRDKRLGRFKTGEDRTKEAKRENERIKREIDALPENNIPPETHDAAIGEPGAEPLPTAWHEEYCVQRALGHNRPDSYFEAKDMPKQGTEEISRTKAAHIANDLELKRRDIQPRIKYLREYFNSQEGIERIVRARADDLKVIQGIINDSAATVNQRMEAMKTKHRLLGWDKKTTSDRKKVPASQILSALAAGKSQRCRWLRETGQCMMTFTDGERFVQLYDHDASRLLERVGEAIIGKSVPDIAEKGGK